MEINYSTWLKYHKGKLLLLAKKYQEARDYIIPIVRFKKNESWAWNILGNTYVDNDLPKAIACLCKALSLNQKDDFTVNIRLELAELLIKTNEYESAKYEINRVVSFKNSQGHKINDNIKRLLTMDWYDSTKLKESNEDIYDKYKAIAEEIFVENLEWIPGLLTGISKENNYYIGIRKGNSIIEYLVRSKEMRTFEGIEIGAPVEVKIDFDNDKPSVLKLKTRNSNKWDLLENYYGIVEHNNTEKGVTNFIIGERKECFAYHDKFPLLKDLKAGDTCNVKGFYFTDSSKGTKFKVCDVETVDKRICSYFKDYSDSIKIPFGKNFGFINDYFVSPYLVEKNSLQNGYKVKCKILFCLNNVKKRNRGGSITQTKEWKWRVLEIEEILSNIKVDNKPVDYSYDDYEDDPHYVEIYNKSYKELYEGKDDDIEMLEPT